MTQKQAIELIIKNALPYFKDKGWVQEKVRGNEAIFIEKADNYLNTIGFSTTDYNPEQLIGFGIGKRIKPVEEIMSKINEIIPFSNPPYTKDQNSLYLLNEKEYIKRDDKSYCTTDDDIVYNLQKIYNYLDVEALPLLERFNDLREIDKLINGDGNDFWETDWKKPFNLAGRFVFRRVIIAKLSGRSDYDKFIEKIKNIANLRAKENNSVIDWSDNSIALVYLISYLNKIEPLY